MDNDKLDVKDFVNLYHYFNKIRGVYGYGLTLDEAMNNAMKVQLPFMKGEVKVEKMPKTIPFPILLNKPTDGEKNRL